MIRIHVPDAWALSPRDREPVPCFRRTLPLIVQNRGDMATADRLRGPARQGEVPVSVARPRAGAPWGLTRWLKMAEIFR